MKILILEQKRFTKPRKLKVVNSIGVSILIEIIEKLQEVGGELGYYNLAPIVEKTFNIMGITKYSKVLVPKKKH